MQLIRFSLFFKKATNSLLLMAVEKEIYLKQLGERIRNVRLKKKLTQFDLASSINKDRQSLQRVESGNVNPTAYYLYVLAEGLGVTVEYLTRFKVEKKIKKKK